jgi:hypothetical protein
LTPNMTRISRPEKARIALKVHDNLLDRKNNGPAEPGLDAFLPELAAVGAQLDTHLAGTVLADAARQQCLARADAADCNVDTWLRHIENFLSTEAHRRIGPNVGLACGLYAAACPDGLRHIDDRIVDENAHCRNTLAVLKAPEHAVAVAGVGLPLAWIATFEAALDASDAALDAVIQARDDKTAHINRGRDAERTWIDVMVRLRRYVGSRAKRTDTDRLREGKELLKPLLDALAKLHADAAARATRRATEEEEPAADATPVAVPELVILQQIG